MNFSRTVLKKLKFFFENRRPSGFGYKVCKSISSVIISEMGLISKQKITKKISRRTKQQKRKRAKKTTTNNQVNQQANIQLSDAYQILTFIS